MIHIHQHLPRIAGLFLAAGAVLAAGSARAQNAAAGARQIKLTDTVITFQTMEADLEDKTYTFEGNVVLVTPTSKMTGDKMFVRMKSGKKAKAGEKSAEPGQGQGQQIEYLKSEGNVTVFRKNPDDGTTLDGTGKVMEYFETEQKANLQGGVVLHQGSEKLAKPAVITGERADLNLKTKENVVTRKKDEQAKAHIEPKGEPGEPEPEPVDLIGNEIRMNSETQTYVATGEPLLVRPSTRLAGKSIRFHIDKQTSDVEVAHAEEDVVFDGQGDNGSVTHATGDHGVFTKATNEIVLTGRVDATTKQPDEERPTVLNGDKFIFIYNSKTKRSKLMAGGNGPAKVVLPGEGAGSGSKKPASPAAPAPAAPAPAAPASGGAGAPGTGGSAGK
jgi:lipopolysaccharide transport protein LptA